MGACESAASVRAFSPKQTSGNKFLFPPLPPADTCQLFDARLENTDDIDCTREWSQLLAIRVSSESFDILSKVSMEHLTLIPYNCIVGWKGSSRHFYLKVNPKFFGKSSITTLKFRTSAGKDIQKSMITSFENFQYYVFDHALHDEDMPHILQLLFNTRVNSNDEVTVSLSPNWDEICDAELGGKLFSATQAIEVLSAVPQTEFSTLMSVCCFLYYRMLHRDSFDLILTAITNKEYRKKISQKVQCMKQRPYWAPSSSTTTTVSDATEDSVDRSATYRPSPGKPIGLIEEYSTRGFF
mmetsp:Transcript_8966/g.13477  ORF Transcript_8966/g.13477 Transcript_8966/m.13477 type:complete len:297 (-) Transcript_8966:216-1106(-)